MRAVTIPRVLCVSGVPTTRLRVCASLATTGFAVLAEVPPIDVMDCIDSYRPDLFLGDLSDIDQDTLLEIREAFPAIPLIALGDGTVAGQRIRSLWHLGIADLLFAPFNYDELSNSVRLTLNRTSSTSFGVDDIIIDEAGHLISRAGKFVDLTATEFKLLVNLVVNAGIVLSKHQILNNVWGFDGYDDNLVEVYVSGLRRKLEEFGPRVIHTVRGVGYVLRGETWGRPERRAIAS